LQVRPPAAQVGFVMVRPAKRGIYVNQARGYGADVVVLDLQGRPIVGNLVTWLIEDPTIASIDEVGTVRGLRPGQTRVRATSGGVSGYGTLVVFAIPDENTAYDLTYDWWDDQWRVRPAVASTTWTDAGGVEHVVPLVLTGGSLTFGRDGGEQVYERRLKLEGWVTVNYHAVKVAERELVDRGLVGIIVGGETGYRMISRTVPGYEWQLVAGYNAGHLLMRDAIGTAPLDGYLLRQRQ
jgi:hypothetical protein